MSEVKTVPANAITPYGNGKQYFPFSIYYNRLGCENTCELDDNVDLWLRNISNYINDQPFYQRNITPRCLDINKNNEETQKIIKRKNQIYKHSKAHIDKHVQLSSCCYTLLRARSTLPWWTYIHTIEYSFYVGLTCTPVSPWFCMEEVFEHYPNCPPPQCLTEVLVDVAKDIQGGID